LSKQAKFALAVAEPRTALSLKSAMFQSIQNGGFSFKPVDFLVKPDLERVFCLAGIQSGESSTLLVKRNMVTWDIFALAQLRDIPHENAFGARMSA